MGGGLRSTAGLRLPSGYREQLDMVEQRVVDLDEAAQRLGETVGQTGAQPPCRTVLAFVDMATLDGTKALGR